ncbi:PP2C family protein-serine/threonine phosphatase [Streptomyces cinerochromogenes]|uniref:PP2C family protein-serine/threonine phosphatase n=1 Tax=Streptomyces cinerochromogenes TaxID=66422 RepID=UPI0016715514|nr:fused response regulator/phosphatase [Streptomyces cinerochromogenes]GGS57014.1 fused response regulator/phosphatase [Streptomyces cinerochromogenes]
MLPTQHGLVGVRVAPGTAAVAGAAWAWQEPSVLLIEDDEADALLVEELVADCSPGMRLTWVRSLAEACSVLAAEAPDCVLLDLHLPDSHGLDGVARVRQCADVAVVVLTGLAEESTGLAAVAAGAQDYLVKGRVEAELFGRAVRYAIQRKLAEQAAAALQAGQLRAEENRRLERGLLPTPLLRDATGLEVVARYLPGREQALLGGDFYDVVQTPDGRVHVLIGDVSGHGPDEAALGVGLRIAWRTLVVSGATGARQLSTLEEILVAERTGEQIFATLTSLELLPDGRSARVMRAGHPGMLLRAGDSVDWVEVPGGPALGVLPGGTARWPVADLTLPDGAGVVLFTDGLFEGRTGPGRERLGEQGLWDLARSLATLPAEAFVDELIGRAEALAEDHGGLADDVAVLHLRWHRQPE